MLNTRNIESLPEDIIINILVRVPAQDICNATRLVCRKWHQMVGTRVFGHAHLQQSTPGLLIHQYGSQPIFLATPKGQIEISNFNCKFKHGVLSSCNGLVLEPREKNNCRDLCITNPLTKQNFALPSFVLPYAKPQFCGIAYAAADMEYKVVRFFYSRLREIECAILTVGVDTDWRRLSLASSYNKFLSLNRTLTTQGFVHWTNEIYSEFLSLNVKTEVITHFSVPAAASRHADGSMLKYYQYLEMGSILSLLVGHCFELSWEVWEMRPETGEWTQMPDIDLSKLKHFVPFERCWFEPVGWSSFREVLVFRVYSSGFEWSHIACNVRTQEIVSTDLGLHLGTFFLPHKISLLWL